MDAETSSNGGGADAAVEELIFSEKAEGYLRGRRNGVLLLGKVVDVVKGPITDLVESMEELQALSTEDFTSLVADSWLQQTGKPMHALVAARIKQWMEGDASEGGKQVSTRPDNNDSALRGALGAGGGVGVGVVNATFAALNAGSDGAILMQDIGEEAGGNAGMLSGVGQAMSIVAKSDCVGQSLSIGEIIAFSASLEKGKCVEIHEIASEVYATDPRGWEVVRRCCKYDESTFSKLLARGMEGFAELLGMLLDLARDLAATKKTQQSVLLSTFINEGQSGFKGDQKSFVAYLRAYRRLYAGRGLPVMWDERMAVRARNDTREAAGPSLSKAEVQAIVKESSSQQVAQLKREIETLKARRPAGGGGGGESADAKAKKLAGTKCFKCHKKGHLAANCPEAEVAEAADEE